MSFPTKAALIGLFVACLATGAALSKPRGASAVTANAGAYGIVYIAEDAFRNWDFHCESSLSCVDPTNVDWPMSLLFWNNAEIDKVKNLLSSNYPFKGGICASDQHARLKDSGPNDTAYYHWDKDDGIKSICCPEGEYANHMRLYAAGDLNHNQMYNLYWRYYVIASTHKDMNEPECTAGLPTSYGYNEDAEYLAYLIWGWLGHYGVYDQQSWANAQNGDYGVHHLRNDGSATTLEVQ